MHVVASWRQFAIGALFLVCLVALVVCLGPSRLSPYRCDLGLSFTLTTFLLMLCIYFFYFFFFLPVLLYVLICFYDYVYTIKLYKATRLHLADTHVVSRQEWSWQNASPFILPAEKPHKGKRLWLKISKPLPTLMFRVSRRLRETCEWSGSHGCCPCPYSDKGFDWNTGYQNLIHFHRAGPRWCVDQDFLGELQKRGPACEAAQPDLCLCDSPYISRRIDDCAARRGSA